VEETCEEDFLQSQAEARGDIPWLEGASKNSTGDLHLSNYKDLDLHQISWISTDYEELKHLTHKQASQLHCPNPAAFSTVLKELCLCPISEKN